MVNVRKHPQAACVISSIEDPGYGIGIAERAWYDSAILSAFFKFSKEPPVPGRSHQRSATALPSWCNPFRANTLVPQTGLALLWGRRLPQAPAETYNETPKLSASTRTPSTLIDGCKLPLRVIQISWLQARTQKMKRIDSMGHGLALVRQWQ